MAVTGHLFLDQLCTAGLLSQADLHRIGPMQSDASPASGQSIISRLVSADLLTKFQAEHASAHGCDSLVYGGYLVVDCLEDTPARRRFRARCIENGSDIALHVFPRGHDSDTANRDIPGRSTNGHPHVAPVLGSGECHDQQFVATEMFEGEDLETVVNQCGPLPLEEAIVCVSQAAQGLAWLYSQGAPARDVSAHQILLDECGNARVLSCELYYGQAAALGDATPDGGEKPSVATVASLGRLLHFLVTAVQPPVGSNDFRAALTSHDAAFSSEASSQQLAKLEGELHQLFQPLDVAPPAGSAGDVRVEEPHAEAADSGEAHAETAHAETVGTAVATPSPARLWIIAGVCMAILAAIATAILCSF